MHSIDSVQVLGDPASDEGAPITVAHMRRLYFEACTGSNTLKYEKMSPPALLTWVVTPCLAWHWLLLLALHAHTLFNYTASMPTAHTHTYKHALTHTGTHKYAHVKRIYVNIHHTSYIQMHPAVTSHTQCHTHTHIFLGICNVYTVCPVSVSV